MSSSEPAEGPAYGASIQRAIARGDLARMESLVPEVEHFLAAHGNVSASLELLKIEIARAERGRRGRTSGTVPLRAAAEGAQEVVASASVRPYGCAIQQAVASGELARMKATASVAARWLAHHGDVGAALQALKIEIAKLTKKRAMP